MKKPVLYAAVCAILATGLMAGKCEGTVIVPKTSVERAL